MKVAVTWLVGDQASTLVCVAFDFDPLLAHIRAHGLVLGHLLGLLARSGHVPGTDPGTCRHRPRPRAVAVVLTFAGVRAVVYPGTRMLLLAKNRLFLRFFVARALMR